MQHAKGTFKSVSDVSAFLEAYSQSELCKPQHHTQPGTLVVVNEGFEFCLFINDTAWFLLESSLHSGMLRHWSGNFRITG